MPYAVYLPIGTPPILSPPRPTATSLFCFCRAEDSPTPRSLITPADILTSKSAAQANATRQINKIIRPEFSAAPPPRRRGLHAQRQLVQLPAAQARSSTTRPAKWTSKKSTTTASIAPNGYAIQKVYSSRSQRWTRRLPCEMVRWCWCPKATIPVVAAHGYNVYYLNALAGSARSMAASDDPEYQWVKDTWSDERSPRAGRHHGHGEELICLLKRMTMAQALVAFLKQPVRGARRRRAQVLPRRLGHLRPRLHRRHRPGACSRTPTSATTRAKNEQASVHLAAAFAKSEEPPGHVRLHLVDRPRRHQHDYRRRDGHHQSPALCCCCPATSSRAATSPPCSSNSNPTPGQDISA